MIGFSSNIKKLVSMKDFLIIGYHLHDCHVKPMIFLVITIRAIKVNIVKLLIALFCYFFAKISHKVIDNYGLGPLWEFIL